MIARHKLVHVITQWDHAEAAKAKRRGYWHNIYALSIMLGALHDAEEDVVDGVPVRSALMRYFNGRLLDRLLKATGQATATLAEHHGY